MSYEVTKSRVAQWLGIILIIAVFAGAYWYFQVYAGYKTNVLSPTGSLTSGLVGYWPFDRVNVLGTTALDRSTSKYNGTLVSNPPVADGKVNQSLDFDGSADYVTMGNQSNLNFGDTADFSISGWFYRDTFTTADVIAAKRNDIGVGETGYSVDIEATDQLALRVSDGSSEFRMYTTATFTTAQWKHFTVVFDQDSAANTKFYIDGQAVSTSTAGTITSIGSLSNAIAFMVGSINGANQFDGKIDELRVYNRVLTATEAQLLYEFSREGSTINSSASQPQGTGRLDSGLAGYWAMDNGSGTSVTDSSTNGNTGTLTGGSSWGTGQIGSAVDLDGTDDYVDMGDLFYSDAFTVCAWVRADVIDANSRNIVVKRNTPGVSAGSNEWTLNASTSGFTFTTWTSASVTALNITGSTVPSTATWYHVCGVENGNGRTGYIYVNGTQNASGTQTAALWDTADRVQIGARSASNDNRYWNGLIDEVRVYNRGLSADEVGDLYRLSTPTAVDTGLKGYWSFNGKDVSGTTAFDRSGAGNTGTLTNGPSVTPGKIGQALSFDGSNDYVSLADNASLQVTNNFTFSFWFKPANLSQSNTYIYSRGQTSSQTGILWEYVDNQVEFFGNGYSGSDPRTGSGITLRDTNWHHIVYTYDGTTWAGYLDGVAIFSTARTFSLTGSAGITLGAASTGVAFVNALIDEFRIYNRALSAGEIQAQYAAGQSDEVNTGASQAQGGGRLDSGLAGYWKLDDGSGTSTTDSSTNGTTGTLTNGPTWTTGQIGGAVNFDGNDDYINGGQGTSLALTDNFTLSTWINPSSLHTTGYFGLKNVFLYRGDISSSTINYLLQVESDTSIVFKKRVGVEAIISYTFTGVPSLTARWSHVTLVVTSGTATLFVDGVKIGTQAIATLGYVAGHYLYLGTSINNNGNSSEQFFIGKIDETRIYNRPLSADQVADLYRLNAPTGTETGLKGYWSFNGKDVSGTTAYDRSGAGNTGTLTGGPSVTPGKIGQALSFDGTDDYIVIPNATSINPSYITVAAWIKTSATGQIDQIFTKDDGSWRVWQFRKSASNTLDFIVFRDSDDTNSSTSGSVTLSDNNWHHVVGTWDGTTIKVFVDGVQDGSGTAFSGVLNASQTNNAFVGAAEVGDGGFFGGIIDELRLYNRALTAAEIYSLYNNR